MTKNKCLFLQFNTYVHHAQYAWPVLSAVWHSDFCQKRKCSSGAQQSISIITPCNIPHFAVLWQSIEKLQSNISIELLPHQLNSQRKKCDTAKVKSGIKERGRKNKLHNSIYYCHLEDFPPKLQQPQSLSRSAPSHLSQCFPWQRQRAYAPIVTGWKMLQDYPCTDVDFDLCLSIHRQQMIFQKPRPKPALCPSWRRTAVF